MLRDGGNRQVSARRSPPTLQRKQDGAHRPGGENAILRRAARAQRGGKVATQQFERTDRIASEIMREVERIIREDVSDPRTECMFSITHVEVTRDLRYAKVHVSIYEEDRRAPMMKALKSAAGFIRHHVGQRVKLRYTPELLFELDTTIEYGVHIASLINQVRKTEERQADDSDGSGK